jgi:hypothetical protein
MGTGLTLKKGEARTMEELQEATVQLSRFTRSKLADGSSTKDKLRDRWCAPLKAKFQTINWSKLMSAESESDIATMTVGVQNVVKEFVEWCHKTDATDISRSLKALMTMMTSESSWLHHPVLTFWRSIGLSLLIK